MDLEDFQVGGLEPSPRPPRWRRTAGAAVSLLVIAAAAYYFFPSEEGETPRPASLPEDGGGDLRALPRPGERQPSEGTGRPELSDVEVPDSRVSEAPEPSIPLPALDESDPLLRALGRRVSTHPRLPSWLVTRGLVRRFVVVVDNIAEGASPRSQLLFLAPEGRFRVSRLEVGENRKRLFIDPAGYERYDLIADVFASVDAKKAAALYRKVEPLVDEAYRELGVPEGGFDDRLSRAFEVLLATPIVEGEIELEPLGVTFAYADPALEELTPAQRHFLRMGPRNVALVQEKLREIAAYLGL